MYTNPWPWDNSRSMEEPLYTNLGNSWPGTKVRPRGNRIARNYSGPAGMGAIDRDDPQRTPILSAFATCSNTRRGRGGRWKESPVSVFLLLRYPQPAVDQRPTPSEDPTGCCHKKIPTLLYTPVRVSHTRTIPLFPPPPLPPRSQFLIPGPGHSTTNNLNHSRAYHPSTTEV